MSLVRSPVVDSAVHNLAVVTMVTGIDHKRKLDEFAAVFDNADLVSGSVKKHEVDTVNRPAIGSSLFSGSDSGPSRSPSLDECSCSGETESHSSEVQFFVRMISEGKTIVLKADKNDTVLALHRRIEAMTNIPVMEQRLIYRGKQLQYEHSLADCAIEKDACLNLVGRMRSTEHPRAWQVVDDILSTVNRMCRGEAVLDGAQYINERVTAFFAMAPKDSPMDYLKTFMASSAPAVLVKLYVSSFKGNRSCAENCIRHFLTTCGNGPVQKQSALMVLEFCKLLRRVACDQPVYFSCRSTLASMMETIEIAWGFKNWDVVEGTVLGKEFFPFIGELVGKISKDMMSMSSIGSIISLTHLSTDDVGDLSSFLRPLRMTILNIVQFSGPISLPLQKNGHNHANFGEEIVYLRWVFEELLNRTTKCLANIDTWLGPEGRSENIHTGWSQLLAILKELHGISKLFQGAEDKLLSVLRLRKTVVCALIIRFADRTDDHKWILEYKGFTDFGARRHLIMMMFHDVKDYDELFEMLIDRSHLLVESFEYIRRADPESLQGGLFMEFKNEEATGPGVLREWFLLVCQEIFDPGKALFVPCPIDRRRFYPNPASKVDPMHLEYFTFSGRVIALALMHKIQVGIRFDRVFYLQLAGAQISLEDIKDADPCMYSSCKQILEMDAGFIDSDALGLTFDREFEELGFRKTIELCPGGKSIVVNSANREEYVNLIIKHRFVTSISEQIACFASGFAAILSDSKLQQFFFRSLEEEDLDAMLYGREGTVCVEDWKAHTEYTGYAETDPEIIWFWKIVGEMSGEQRKVLLFFWTSMKHLPIEGFGGLASRLQIYKSYASQNHLPSSHTCFYRLDLPKYPTMAVMKERLNIITQDHVGCSFGTS